MKLSVIVPAFNCPRELRQCLDALRAADPAVEVIVVDDASPTDDTLQVAEAAGVITLRMDRNGGPGAARNLGARAATGDVLVFVDSDVVVSRDALARVRAVMQQDPSLAALFGSYDDSPAAPSWVSTYRNLLHHYVHQTGNPEASTFWAGLGAVRRTAFEQVGGFDARRFSRPSIEDIELGYRLRAAGLRIRLDRDIQAKHLKHWTLKSVVLTDVFCRAIPWSRLILQSGTRAYDLNLSRPQRASAALALGAAAAFPLGFAWPPLFLAVLAGVLGVLAINRRLYAFFHARRGAGFAVTCVGLHLLYLLYSASSYLFVKAQHVLGHLPAPEETVAAGEQTQ